VGDAISSTDLSDTNPATNETTIGLTGNDAMRVAAVQPSTGVLYTTTPSRLGTVNSSTGLFTAFADPYGALSGPQGNRNLNDVRGLAFDPTDGTLYAISRNPGDNDSLFKVNPSSGAAIPDAFGPGMGYVEMISNDLDQAGTWQWQGRIVMSSWEGKTSILSFEVVDNL